MSDRFAVLERNREVFFPRYTNVTRKVWSANFNGKPQSQLPNAVDAARSQKLSADAVTKLLNYYEFLAVGLAHDDLDEDLLKSTVRSIMCNLVDDCRWFIARLQLDNPKTYEHVSALYEDWRDKSGTMTDPSGNPTERPIPDIRSRLGQPAK